MPKNLPCCPVCGAPESIPTRYGPPEDRYRCQNCGDTHFSPDYKLETELGDVWD